MASASTPDPQEAEVDFKVFKPPGTDPNTLQQLPDSFFDPTPADLLQAQATLTARTKALANAPLQVRATREAAQKAKLEKWPTTTIRVKFPDRTHLQKVFPSTDRIRAVYAFVYSCLREDVKPIKFILYQSPPKRDLRNSDPAVNPLSLAELQLAPSSLLLLRFEDPSLNGSSVPAPLTDWVLSRAVDFPFPQAVDAATSNDTATSARNTAPSSSKSKPTPTVSATSNRAEQKLRQWLKLGKK